MVQYLVESGWADIMYDHIYRYGKPVLSILYFFTCHLAMVFVMVSLLQGVVWDIYDTVHNDLNAKLKLTIDKERQQKDRRVLKEVMEWVHAGLNNGRSLKSDCLAERKIIEGKLDSQILTFVQGIHSQHGAQGEQETQGADMGLEGILGFVDEIDLQDKETVTDREKIMMDLLYSTWNID